MMLVANLVISDFDRYSVTEIGPVFPVIETGSWGARAPRTERRVFLESPLGRADLGLGRGRQ